ncbi:MAG: hypothetical protein J2P54_09525 [Bradyrhizobiaceae bacterium]|nr:hypothetical protein [Bradyrhizobiaceae bacterium]
MIAYEDSGLRVRADIVQAHNVAWGRIARAGAWLDGAARIAIAAETRNVSQCRLCRRRKEALSPNSISGRHDGLGVLPDRIVEQIHRIVSDPGRLTRKWFDDVIASGTPDVEYVEIVGVIATIVSIDTFCRAIGVPPHPLPEPLPGRPHQRRPRTAHQRGEAWVPMIHPRDLEGDLDTEEEKALAKYWGGVQANIRRALSLVPEEAFAWFQLVETQYLPGRWMRDFSREFRAITHAQIELIAGRVSVLNQCFY